MIKRAPQNTRGLLSHAYDFIKYMPIDKNTTNAFKPIIEMTKTPFIQENMMGGQERNNINNHYQNQVLQNNQKNNVSNISQNNPITKRSVSETKKKFVASKQNWKCGHCNNQLDHTYEIDHIQDLRYGGDNNVENLIALCRNCHGKKTLMSKINN